ncbi:MAG: proteasome assembly chaperone family protein [Promethearchaeota archaeon]
MAIEIQIFKELDALKGKYLVTGFFGIGSVGFLTVKALIEETKSKKIGIIVSTNMPPLVSVDNNGDLSMPFEFYLDEDNGFIYLLIRFQPHPSEIREFAKTIVEFVANNEIKGLILLGGLDKNFKKEADALDYKCVITNEFQAKYLPTVKKEELPIIDKGLFISGGIALILIELQRCQIPALTIFVYADKDRPDMMAATKTIEIINKIFSKNIKIEKMIQEANEFEKEIERIMKHEASDIYHHDFYT